MANYIDYLESLSKKQLMVMLARQRHEETQGIAVVGMACRFPAGIDDPQRFWTMLHEGRAVPTRWEQGPTDSLGRPRWNLSAPDLAPIAELLRSGSYLDNIDVFDAEYFGLSDDEALHMDPQQRLLLEVTVQALADANLTRAQLAGQRVGIFIGTSPVEYPHAWLRNGLSPDATSPFGATGSAPSAGPGRLGFMLGVRGPAMAVDTASSSMLVALHLAGQSLRRRECDLAIIGVCNLLLSPFSAAILASAGMLSRSGSCRPFGDDADGHVRGEGCGIFVLKRLSDAASDGDLPYAVIRGSAVYQHGDRLGLTVASASGQKAVIDLALRAAGIGPLEVQYLEAQANGSRIGGMVEAEAIAEAYGRQVPTAPPLYLGSCKANLGYFESASGAPGLMKTVLVVAHGEIPPQIGADQLDRSVAWERTALRFVRTAIPWPSAGRRIAALSAFAFTGTLTHVIVENAPDPLEPSAAPAQSPALLVVSAHNTAALAATARRLQAYLASRADWTYIAVCRTLAEARDLLDVRHGSIVHGRQELLDALARLADGASSPAPAPHARGVFLIFPKLGSELGDEPSSTAIRASRAFGFEALAAFVRARAEAMKLPPLDGFWNGLSPAPPGMALAWAMAWIDLVTAAGLEITGGTFGGLRASALVDIVTGQTSSDETCARWASGAFDSAPLQPTQRGGWEISFADGACTVRRPARSGVPLAPAALDMAGWLGILAAQLHAGAPVRFSALAPSRRGLCRLPGPVFTGKSYWPAQNLWS